MVLLAPRLMTTGVDKIWDRLMNVALLGFSEETVIKMAKSYPTLLCITENTVNSHFKSFISLGYEEDEVKSMVKSSASLLCLASKTIESKFNNLVDAGYTKEEVKHITIEMPTIYELSKENINDRIEYYDSIGLHDIMLKHPKHFMQSTGLTYARYMYLNSIGDTIDGNNFMKLFCSDKNFIKYYGIEKETLLEKYDYSEYKESKKAMLRG